MNEPNPSLERRWLQVAGLPLGLAEQAVRAEIDRVTHVEVLPDTSRVILYDRGGCIGALDLMPANKGRIDAAIAVPEEEARKPDPARGDTIIRTLDLSNPADAALLKGPRVIHDPAAEPPLIELPDYTPDGSDPERDLAAELARERRRRAGANTMLGLAVLALLAALFFLSGCTSMGELRSHEPRATYLSSRPPADIVDCLVGDINQLGAATVIERAGTTTVAFTNLGNTSLVVTLRPTPGGTEVQARQLIAYFSKRSLEKCTASQGAE